jgi:hypothetical protein
MNPLIVPGAALGLTALGIFLFRGEDTPAPRRAKKKAPEPTPDPGAVCLEEGAFDKDGVRYTPTGEVNEAGECMYTEERLPDPGADCLAQGTREEGNVLLVPTGEVDEDGNCIYREEQKPPPPPPPEQEEESEYDRHKNTPSPDVDPMWALQAVIDQYGIEVLRDDRNLFIDRVYKTAHPDAPEKLNSSEAHRPWRNAWTAVEEVVDAYLEALDNNGADVPAYTEDEFFDKPNLPPPAIPPEAVEARLLQGGQMVAAGNGINEVTDFVFYEAYPGAPNPIPTNNSIGQAYADQWLTFRSQIQALALVESDAFNGG